ncbi:SNF2 family N-terminal domain-containing protein [Zopfochytrium polystomum]|nr:SNF2 family N-terminal domain-containing protein [Zopfochytrium polystomum]
MTTRLDRLILLLETGSTPSVRSTAAQQIGDVQRQHPDELYNLLARVLVHLRSKTWETRVAASQAIEAIAKNVPVWNPPAGVPGSMDDSLDAMAEDDGRLTFNLLNIETVVISGTPLLASSGGEFAVDLSHMDPRERILHQKKLLKQRLGIEAQLMDLDLLTESDLKNEATSSAVSQSRGSIPQQLLSVGKSMDDESALAGLSARERAARKRKMRVESKRQPAKEKVAASSLSTSSLKKRKQPTEDGDATKKVKVEDESSNSTGSVVIQHKPKEDEALMMGVSVTGDEWPFEGLCEQLCLDLFHQNWEIRHGAALGLREILKIHGSGAGKVAGVSALANETKHANWQEDVAIRLLCVLALDRFADFVGDHVVVPVRETCAQTLSVLVQKCDRSTSLKVVHQGLLKLIQGGEGVSRNRQNASLPNRWEVRHAGLIGLKYWMAVRKDLLKDVVVAADGSEQNTGVFVSIMNGLRDRDDDVRSVASSTLLPISDILVDLLGAPKVFNLIVKTLWESLLELDDLTAATASVMDLLSQLLTNTKIETIMLSEPSESLVLQIPRLFPFFRHALTSVRTSVLRTVRTLAHLCGSGSLLSINWVTDDLLRLIFQNFVLEEKEALTKLTLEVWEVIVPIWARIKASTPMDDIVSVVQILFKLIMTPVGTPLESNLLRSFTADSANPSGGELRNVSVHDRAIAQQDLTVVAETDVVRGRVAGATALGELLNSLHFSCPDVISEIISKVLGCFVNSGWANHRIFACIALQEWAASYSKSPSTDRPFLDVSADIGSVWSQLVSGLVAADGGASLLYNEILYSLGKLRSDCQGLINAFAEFGAVGCPPLPPLPSSEPVAPDTSNPFGPVFTKHVAERFLAEVVPQLLKLVAPGPTVRPSVTNPNPPDRHTFLQEKVTKIESTIVLHTLEQSRWDVAALASSASAIVCMGRIPPKQNPVVRTLMSGVKNEEFELIQIRNASAIATLIHTNAHSPKASVVNDKIVNNLGILLCEEADWGSVLSEPMEVGILSVKLADSQEKGGILSLEDTKKSRSRKKDQAGTSIGVDLATAGVVIESVNAATLKSITSRRGARLALEHVCRKCGDRLFKLIPKVWELSTGGLSDFLSEDCPPAAVERSGSDKAFAQITVDSLLVLSTILPAVEASLKSQLLALLRNIIWTLSSPLAIVRHAGSHCLATFSKCYTVPTMQSVIHHVVPLLNDSTSVVNRQGAIECIFQIVTTMDGTILLPYIVFLIVPVLSRMSDSDEAVRFVATSVFAYLVRLVPLESGVPDPEGMDEELIRKKVEERKFMGQLVGTEKVESFEVPKGIRADLRPYQKEGVSWLAFLNRYGLHGILCDDMGLGKTLQSICMLASDHHLRAEKYAKTGSPDVAHAPSIVVCPPTLTGHWVHEIQQFAGDIMRPLLYSGGPVERTRHRADIPKYDVVIISYDILRNDIEALNTVNWNYCILDEGHIIKNSKTKLTKAVKSLKCMRRLILSGTPVQNNVLELWSLFDFLMPGFLGTEQQFNSRFGKPILASREAKSSSREQEEGALALEALHKQVLPFLLRRMKEDVLNDLPPKIIQDYYVELSNLQKSLYEDFGRSKAAAGVSQELTTRKEVKESAHVFQALQYLKKLCNHPALVLKASHPLYDQFVKQLLAEGSKLNDIKHSPKLTALRQLLNDCGIGLPEGESDAIVETTAAHRALVFCQSKDMLDYIENGLFKTQMPTVSFLRMDGSTDAGARHDMVRKFNADPSIDVFLLTTSVGGLGLNLTGADTVIFVEHDWNPMKDLQAMDRAHRIGQKRVVNVYRLITKGTLEEKIMGLQKFKLNIASSVINQDNTGIGTMDTDQILDLFSFGDSKGDKRKEASADDTKKMSAREVLEGIGSLWDENQYEAFDSVDGFLSTLQK